jgi:vancomycin resistance protein YoaR
MEARLNRERLAERLGQMAAEFDIAPVEPRIRFASADAITATERLRIIQPGQDGRRLEVEPALDLVIEALGRGQSAVDLPVAVAQPGARPDTLDSLGIVELVAQGKSSFANSESYRIANIQAGARRMDGVLIPPDGEFSFNQTVGAVDASNGFTQGYAIVNGRTQLEWGGGICQISTTVFRAAFWAGVPITERHYHTYRLNWYEVYEPVGMDATIFTPYGPDMRFVNDTGHWLLMEAFADTTNQIMYINLYGTKTGRDVVQLTPSVTGNAFGGVDVNLGRIVRQNGSVLHEDNFFSRFKPWPNL